MKECIGKDMHNTLSLYRNLKVLKDGMRHVRYEYAEGAHSERLIAQSVSQQEFSGQLCGALSAGEYHDVDVVDCHNAIIHQLLNKLGRKCLLLNGCMKAESRDIVLTAIAGRCSVADAKKLLRAATYGKGVTKEQCKFFKAHVEEARPSVDFIAGKTERLRAVQVPREQRRQHGCG